ncbi:MAG TPA: ion transporter [Leptospiraceae bacterium]|nr:ion transporter [Leptospiraceae bacterium]HNJ33777.1 ion transporter [Leptospiraceae bacterium]
MIHPEGVFKQAWNALILVCTLFFAIEIPMRMALGYHIGGWLFAIDVFITVCFMVDVVINFFTAEYVNGVLVTDKKVIAITYLKGWFLIDFLAAVPLDMVFVGALATLSDTARVFRLLRLARMARIAQFMRKLAQADIINISVLRMLFLTFWVLMVAHWSACVWIALGGTIGGVPDDEKNSLLTIYVRSLYWATTTITTIGYGDLTPGTTKQTIFTMLIQLTGAGLYGYVIGNIASLIANLDVARAQYLEKLEKIGTYMKFKKLPHAMQQEVRNYYTYLWDTRRGYDESQVLVDLPKPIVEKVSMYLLQQMIEKVPIFKGANEDLIRQIVIALKPEVYTPGDYIFRKGDMGGTMYFIGKGEVQVVGDDGKTVFATLSEGNFFGEIALLMSMPRTASIRAVDFCDLYSLEKETFNGIVEHYPDFSAHILELARARAREIGNRDTVTSTEAIHKPPRPARVVGLTASRVDDALRLSWEGVDTAAVYQVIRKGEGRWTMVNGFVQNTVLIDHPLTGLSAYRVRAANESGPGDWSDVIEVAMSATSKNP